MTPPSPPRRIALALALWAALIRPVGAQQSATAPFEVHEASVGQLGDALAAGRTTSVQLVDAYLARIAAYDQRGPALNAIVRLNPAARADAEALDRERRERGPRGPLHGVPVLLKDNYEVAGLVASNGSIAFAGWMPERDAPIVHNLREAGAVILGLTNMHELASGITTIASVGGQTRNPYDPARNPGGSSGGTGAAVAASFAALGWGSDTCGSIRIPASHQSLFGLRPSRGLFDAGGIFPLSHTQDVPGPLARTAEDLAVGLDATLPAGAPVARGRFRAALASTPLRGLRVGVLANYFGTAPEELEVLRVIRPALDSMKAHGAEVLDVRLPLDLDSVVGRAGVINYEHKWDMLDFLAERPAAEVKSLADLLRTGLYHTVLANNLRGKDTLSTRDGPSYRAALATQDELRRAVLALLEESRLDVLVYPTIRRKPAIIGEPQYGTTCGLSATTGLPAITIPAGFTNDGLPVGVEALGRSMSDDRLVGIAHAVERVMRARRAPFATPPLVDGRAPAPGALRVVARSPEGASVVAELTYDRTRGTLAYRLGIDGQAADPVRAVTLGSIAPDGSGPVQLHLFPAGAPDGTGTIALTAALRRSLLDGGLALVLYTRSHPRGTLRTPVVVP